MTAALSGPDSRVRGDAARALGRIGADARPAVPELIRAATREQVDAVARQAASALIELGSAASPGLVAALHDGETRFRLRLLETLTQQPGQAAVPVAEIARCLADPDADVRQAAATALAGREAGPRPSPPFLAWS